jgi:hypothetical protein
MQFNETKLNQAIETSKTKTSDPHWLNAIEKAHQQLIQNSYITIDGDVLLILSASNNLYHSNGTCRCETFKRHMPYWHRAAARLVALYNEQEAAPAAVSAPNAGILIKREGRSMKIGAYDV